MQLMAGDEWSSCLPDRTRIVRTRSKNGAQRERLQEMLRSTFLKRETFMVMNLNCCGLLHWINLSLARDAHNAVSRTARTRQDVFFQ